MAEDVILACGTIAEHQTTGGEWKRIPRLTSIGAVGEHSEPKEKTTLEDCIKKYGSGLRDAPDKSLKGQYIPFQEVGDEYYDDYLLQQEFIARCRNEEEFPIRITWPDGEINGWLHKALGFEFDEVSQEDWKMWTSNGKQNSRVMFDVTVTGTATVTVGNTTQLTATGTPVDNTADVTWESSDEQVATVSATGLVTGSTAGTTVITAEIRGVVGSLEVTVS